MLQTDIILVYIKDDNQHHLLCSEGEWIMETRTLPGFTHFTTHHCVTGSLRHIYEFNKYPISEEMLLGLGAGMGFIYWHMKGALPFLGGRTNLERPGTEGLEKAIGRRTGVQVESHRTNSAAKAENALLELLASGQPVMLLLDMGYLPYFDFGGEEFHFGYHAVVICGHDPQNRQVLIADRDEALHLIALESLARARGSKFKPFPPQHCWYTFDFSHNHPPQAEEVHQAIQDCVRGMLEAPIANIGIKGIRKTGRRLLEWPKVLSEKELRDACINTAIMIDARGGTGGGLFRYMYGRFLAEAAALTGQAAYARSARQMQTAGDGWEEAAKLFEAACQAENPGQLLQKISLLLLEIAAQEEEVWNELKNVRLSE
jgi:hypothetical protein